MKRESCTDRLFDDPIQQAQRAGRELIVDCFAGGGGASEGIFQALGRHPDIAVNHDPKALAMHRANHPDTLHISKNIYRVDPMEVVRNRPVGLLWSSPDCKHHSKAKGGRPVKRNIRDLGWTVVTWAKRARPRVIILENVEEFRDWGPVVPDDRGNLYPCPKRKGSTFMAWVKELRRLGYKVEWQELRACDYGVPTIRKRLFVIARRDGKPIVWPKPTHGAPDSPDVISGKLLPWRGAHECIDWSIPCPSIFDTSEEIFEKFGVRAKRPLAEATQRRIARGVQRYVIEDAAPFIVSVAHGDSGGRREYPITEPMGTQTGAGNTHALVAPVVSYAQQGGGNRSVKDPMHTVTASPKDQNCVLGATLIQTGYGERPGQAPRVPGLHGPIGTQVAGGAKHAVVAAFLAKHNTGATGASLRGPAPTITANGFSKRPGGAAPIGLVAASMASLRGAGPRGGYSPNDPLHTVSAGGTHEAVASAFLSRQFGNSVGSDAREPIGTITAGGGGKAALVAAFLDTYYGTEQRPDMRAPMPTDTTKDRRSLVTVQFSGQTYVLEDIGMRMLTPRERFRAQGFGDHYEIEHGIDEHGQRIALTKTEQGRMCGNSVCPGLAEVIVAANCPDLVEKRAAA